MYYKYLSRRSIVSLWKWNTIKVLCPFWRNEISCFMLIKIALIARNGNLPRQNLPKTKADCLWHDIDTFLHNHKCSIHGTYLRYTNIKQYYKWWQICWEREWWQFQVPPWSLLPVYQTEWPMVQPSQPAYQPPSSLYQSLLSLYKTYYISVMVRAEILCK